MKMAFKRHGMWWVITLLLGFIGGSYYTAYDISHRDKLAHPSPEPRAEVYDSSRFLPGNLNIKGVEGTSTDMSPISHHFRSDSEGIQTLELFQEMPPEILGRLTNGEYILQYEFPTARTGLSNHVILNVNQYRSIISREYGSMFRELGLNEAVTAKIENHLASIQHARVEAEAYLIQLDEAKDAYDQQMKQLLTSDQYRAYRDVEAARPAMRELSTIKEYIERGNGNVLRSEDEGSLLEVLKLIKRGSTVDGPYGLGTRAWAGQEKVLAGLAEDMGNLQEEHRNLLQNLKGSGLSEQFQSTLEEYYREKERMKQEEIKAVTAHSPSPAGG
jgi:hypothetical protein